MTGAAWIDLDKRPEQSLFDLQLTSASQPFGYEATGYKLNRSDRLKARERFEPQGTEIRIKGQYAHSHELFSGFIDKTLELHSSDGYRRIPGNGYPEKWPPPPAKVDLERFAPGGMMIPLHEILRRWTQATVPREEALALLVSRDHSRFECLCRALRHFDEAEIALLDASSVGSGNLPIFYDRIGAGGTALGTEERLFSFYKSKQPAFHNIVCDINGDNGRIMVPSKIAASAIRIANALAHQQRDQEQKPADRRPGEGNRSLTDISQFARLIETTGAAAGSVDLPASLDELVGLAADGYRPGGRFRESFGALFKALTHDGTDRPLGFPTVLLSRLSQDLFQVLLFWLLHTRQRFDDDDNHLFRFVIFWHLCVRSDDKASNRCFRLIRETETCSLKALFRAIRSDGWLSRDLVPPDTMAKFLVTNPPQAAMENNAGSPGQAGADGCRTG